MRMTTYYKAVRPDGTDFYSGTVQWAPPGHHEDDWIVRHPTATEIGNHASAYLSVATVPTDCTNMYWPCRLLMVESVGDIAAPSPALPNKRAGIAFRVTGERPAHEALGPQGEYVAALIDRASRLTVEELDGLDAAWCAARYATPHVTHVTPTDATRYSGEDATRYSAWEAAGVATEHAAVGLVMRDLISTEKYDMSTRPWRVVVGPIHPDDPDWKNGKE